MVADFSGERSARRLLLRPKRVPQSGSGLPSTIPPSPQSQDLRPQISLTPAQVADVQSLLAAQGVYRGPVDGQMSGSLRSGILQFQLAARIPATGQLDAATAAALGVQSPSAATATFGTPFPLSGAGENPSSLFIQP